MALCFEKIPERVFLDTTVVNDLLDFGEQIFDGMAMPPNLSRRRTIDLIALTNIWLTGSRANWQTVISSYTLQEVQRTRDPTKRFRLEQWYCELWGYWTEVWDAVHPEISLPSESDLQDIRRRLVHSKFLAILPDESDRILICDALAYQCDTFCTRDWSTILRHRDKLSLLGLRIISPSEWWAIIRPYAPIWV